MYNDKQRFNNIIYLEQISKRFLYVIDVVLHFICVLVVEKVVKIFKAKSCFYS